MKIKIEIEALHGADEYSPHKRPDRSRLEIDAPCQRTVLSQVEAFILTCSSERAFPSAAEIFRERDLAWAQAAAIQKDFSNVNANNIREIQELRDLLKAMECWKERANTLRNAYQDGATEKEIVEIVKDWP